MTTITVILHWKGMSYNLVDGKLEEILVFSENRENPSPALIYEMVPFGTRHPRLLPVESMKSRKRQVVVAYMSNVTHTTNADQSIGLYHYVGNGTIEGREA